MAERERLLFLTGKLAHDALQRELAGLKDRAFDYEVLQLGLSVAALMTSAMIRRRLGDTRGADRIIVPGLCSGDLDTLGAELGVPVQKGPKDLKDLPEFFGGRATPPDLSRYRVRIFAEIVEAPELTVEAI
ncbi:MAG: DUF6513 domain-containing protein, partial [Candidatus Competibacterales bacterium]|nr:DUF6513 domain-containing protein [Candidatus Competibacterales bacterium]